ncbi:hypothetical protein Tsubulata_043970 [Turnera subulata]|uniref:Small RNA 2'-O-methyltransferase n=1 Tax=Turnera subulata TaxID=218843 RepID=A0A9Q0FRQ5_9ROSI|nr:hypothetical protein Tsubulata_043970 [Turnera subulata]
MKFLSSLHPLGGHLRAALQRNGDLYGFVPASIITVCDARISNLCKLLNPKVESNPYLAASIIMRAAAGLSGYVVASKGNLSIQKKNPYPPAIIKLSDIQQSVSQEDIVVKVIHIPPSLDKIIQPSSLDVPSSGYYLDIIAQKLGVRDANKVFMSRTVGKASSEVRLYFAAPESLLLDISSDLNVEEFHMEGSLNARASYFCGQAIYGDAIMASLGYTWRSGGLFHEDVSLQSYYRMLISKIPSGNYKLSREAILAAEMPLAFTSKNNWKGSFPKEILCALCRQHRLSEPVLAITIALEASCELSRSQKKLKVAGTDRFKTEYANGKDTAVDNGASVGSGSGFRCQVKILSKCQDLIIECFPKEVNKKQSDSIHNASLKVLSWLDAYFKDLDMPLEKLNYLANALDIQFHHDKFFKEFALCPSVYKYSGTPEAKLQESKHNNSFLFGQGVWSLSIEGSDSGLFPSTGCLVSVSYSVSLMTEDGHVKELLESNDEFEFEMGTGAVISSLESVVTQLSVGQSAFFKVELPPEEFIFAAADDFRTIRSMLSVQDCCLDYAVTLLAVTEPPEERMEQAFFSPPLSKQRVEYAVKHIREFCATTLVDFGCGSGSLLDSLLEYPTSLEKIVGVDISQKSLSRAAKILHSKLSTKIDAGIRSLVLYDGSITDFNSRLCGFDIGTCLEVIEHMEEDQASLFGNVALSYFRPKILIVSTPNYEYNTILQKSGLATQDDDPDERNQSQACKFRNHDHKFEWTRKQFDHWATELAKEHNYSVEFSGVGGAADVEPGFASQIAVFKRGFPLPENGLAEKEDSAQHCKLVWEWSTPEMPDMPASSL